MNNSEEWVIERDKEPPRVFGRGATMKHNIPLQDLMRPYTDDNGNLKRDCLKLKCDPETSQKKIGTIRAFVQRHIQKLERNSESNKKDLPKFSIMFGENKESILIWRIN